MSTAENPAESERRFLIESDRHQTRVAVLEEGRLTEIHLERKRTRSVVGSVYKGRVSRILPGMQAAFVDIGLTRDAFLFAGDVRVAFSAIDELSDADPQTQELPPVAEKPIEEMLTVGQELIVQVVKAPLPNKGARITTEVTLPGRYLVFVPTVPGNGISRRLQCAEERDSGRTCGRQRRPDRSHGRREQGARRLRAGPRHPAGQMEGDQRARTDRERAKPSPR